MMIKCSCNPSQVIRVIGLMRCAKAVVVVETVQKPCNICCKRSGREIEWMKVERYQLRRSTNGFVARAVGEEGLERIEEEEL